MAIVGIGVDVCDVARFDAAMQRTPRIVERLFTAHERVQLQGRAAQSYAARFAVKEAVAKVLQDTRGLLWHDCEVIDGVFNQPELRTSGTVAQAAHDRGIQHWHVSVSHDGGMAMAFVVGER